MAKALQQFGQHYNSMGTRLQKSGAITTVWLKHYNNLGSITTAWVLGYKKAEPSQQHGQTITQLS
jgi:hypothetical protein